MNDNAKSTPKTVLCIEDEHFISELYTRALNKAGYEVKTIYDGNEGVREALTDKYDIILLDIMIPGIDGLEVLRLLRGPEAALKVNSRIIITTNLDLDENTRAAIEEQADGYLIKAEITPTELVDFISQTDTPHDSATDIQRQ